jgi:hypothetical protein
VIVRPVILTDGPKTNAYRALVDLLTVLVLEIMNWTFYFLFADLTPNSDTKATMLWR